MVGKQQRAQLSAAFHFVLLPTQMQNAKFLLFLWHWLAWVLPELPFSQETAGQRRIRAHGHFWGVLCTEDAMQQTERCVTKRQCLGFRRAGRWSREDLVKSRILLSGSVK